MKRYPHTLPLLTLATFLLSHGFAASPALAQAAAPAPARAQVHGQISDPTGAVIPGAKLSLTTPDGHTVGTATSDGSGAYQLGDLPAGLYIVLINAPGFAPFASKAVTLAPGQAKQFDATLAIQTAQQTVQVNENTPLVSVSPESNANSITITGKDLDALSDDPDELSDELTALAGPAAGPSGGQVYIDGFTAGQLPPKSAIREIRVNQNPYSAQFDKLGFGRVEILTKPGSDKYHGQFFGQGNARPFNTGNPFTKDIPDYDTYQYNGTVSGPLGKNASFFVSAEHRHIQDDAIISANPLLGDVNGDFASGNYNNPADFNTTAFNSAVSVLRSRTNISPRLDLQLGEKNTLVARYQFEDNSDTNQGVGQFSLGSQAYKDAETEHTLQLSDTFIVNPKIINETHLQLIYNRSSQTPASTTPQVQVQGFETFGGQSEQSINDHTDRYELSNLTELALGNHAINFGGRLRATREANSANSSFNGLYTFGSRPCPATATSCPANGQPLSGAQAYAITLQGQAAGESFAQIQAAGGGPSQLVYVTGSPKAEVSLVDVGLYYQDDWKVKPNLTFSYGLRFESQTDIHDKNDWAPRFALAYGFMKNGKPTKDVLRLGYGWFYDRFGVGNVLQATRDNGILQQETVVQSPTCYFPGGLPSAATLTGACGGAAGAAGQGGQASYATRAIYQVSPTLHAPINEQASIGIDHQLTKQATLSVTYINSRGLHALDTINANAPYSPTYDAALGNIYQYYSGAVFHQNQLFVNINARFNQKFSLFGFYGLNYANSDTSGTGSNPSNSLDIRQDYGRASFDTRNRLFLIGTYAAPAHLRFSPFVVASSGSPFNITLSQDTNGDSFFNNRPSFAPQGSSGANIVSNSYGTFNTSPAAGDTPIPINYGKGPALFTFNLRVSKTFGFGATTGKEAASSGAPGPIGPGGPPRGGGRGGPGGPGGGGDNTGKRYNLTFNAQALNLFNVINYAPPTGSIDSEQFGRSNALAGMIFSSGSAARRINLQATFTF